MKLKRTIGTGKIFLYSCGLPVTLAGIVWLIINAAYAIYISGKELRWSWFYSYTKSAADIVTPWLLTSAAIAIYYRYWKMCSANNVSCTGQTAMLSLMSIFVSAAFAAADLLAAKLVMQPLYGGIIITQFEDDSTYFGRIICNYVQSLSADAASIGSPYTINTLLMLFTIMTVYYYCFFLVGCYIMKCFSCRKRKLLIYYAVTFAFTFLTAFFFSNIESEFSIFLAMTVICIDLLILLTNPVVFSFALPIIISVDEDTILLGSLIMSAFILITISCIEVLGLEQLPNRKRVRKELKKYNEQNNFGKEGTLNDRQT